MILIAVCFVGYIIGRAGDWYAGHWDFFHHWIYGIILMLIGFFINDYLFYFGLGLVISDFKDLLNLEFFGPDKKDKKTILGI